MQKIQNSLGRNVRYMVTDNIKENTFTMAVNAGKEVLKNSKISISEIDMIVFVSATPEYNMPTNAIKIHRELGGKAETICYDINANCIGGFVAIDQVSKYLNASSFANKALVICSEKFSDKSGKENPITTFCFSDSAFAFILEKDDSSSGLIDIMYHTDSNFTDTIIFPPNGDSCKTTGEEIFWDSNFDGSGSVNFALNSIDSFLNRNGLKTEEIDLFLFSQLSIKNINTIVNHYSLPVEKAPFYGREYAYTGASSPLMAFDQYKKNIRKIEKGENILLWTLGAGYQAGLMLWKY